MCLQQAEKRKPKLINNLFLKQNKTYISTKDFLVSGESFDLIYDSDREMLVTFPQPIAENLASYYESENYISHTDSKKGLIPFLYQKVKNYSLDKKVDLIDKLQNEQKTLLDIGAGTGEFLKVAKNRSWNVSGVEVNEKARNLSKEKGINLQNHIEDFANHKFDVVTLWHVLEHLPNLEKTIVQIENLVKPNGHLIIAVPNFKSYDSKYYNEFWAAYDTPRHLWHFSKKTMQKIFSNNMELVNIKPMLFDSFYVSLLSEKYKKKNGFAPRAFFIGLLSNLAGLFTKEYSSQIYIYKKH